MIAKKYKVSKQFFPQVMKGRVFSGIYTKITISKSISEKNPHFAVVISKKHLKKAYQRNLVKRMIFDLCAENSSKFPIKTIVFSVQKSIPFSKNRIENKTIKETLKKEVQELINKVIHEKNS